MMRQREKQKNANVGGYTIKKNPLNIKSCERLTKHLILLRAEMPQVIGYLKRFALPSIYVTNPRNFRRQSLSNLISNIVAVILLRFAAMNCSKETPRYNFEINSPKTTV